jgi:serine/threonine protein kinase
VTVDDFVRLKQISAGAFGKVILVRKQRTGDIYAMKEMSKLEMERKNQAARVRDEERIMQNLHNPFIVDMIYSFQDETKLYIVMEYCPGGDLYSLLRRFGSFEERVARQYASELVLALEYLHSHGIIHRDLKPDNILVARDGHLKLIDFGLSHLRFMDEENVDEKGERIKENEKKQKEEVKKDLVYGLEEKKDFSEGDFNDAAQGLTGNQKKIMLNRKRMFTAYSLVGSFFFFFFFFLILFCPDYLAPEILTGKGHDAAVDWWAFGCILFEFLVGLPPFYDHSGKEAIFDKIINRRIDWSYASHISEEARSLIEQLLESDPLKRLGTKNDAAAVKQHSFFAGIDWDCILLQTQAFIPKLVDELDTSYFITKSDYECVNESEIIHGYGMGEKLFKEMEKDIGNSQLTMEYFQPTQDRISEEIIEDMKYDKEEYRKNFRIEQDKKKKETNWQSKIRSNKNKVVQFGGKRQRLIKGTTRYINIDTFYKFNDILKSRHGSGLLGKKKRTNFKKNILGKSKFHHLQNFSEHAIDNLHRTRCCISPCNIPNYHQVLTSTSFLEDLPSATLSLPQYSNNGVGEVKSFGEEQTTGETDDNDAPQTIRRLSSI